MSCELCKEGVKRDSLGFHYSGDLLSLCSEFLVKKARKTVPAFARTQKHVNKKREVKKTGKYL